MVLITCVWKQSFPLSMYSKSLERERERERERRKKEARWRLEIKASQFLWLCSFVRHILLLPYSTIPWAHLWDTHCCFSTVHTPNVLIDMTFQEPWTPLSLSLSLFLSLPLPPNHLIWIFLIVDLNIVCVLSINQKLTTNKQRQMVSYALKKLVHSQVEKPLWTCIQPKTYLPLFFISARRFYT